MNDWFEWNGVKSTDYGIHVSEHPPITIPNERATFTAVPGRAGTLTTVEGDDVYDDMILSATCFIDSPDQIPVIAAWLRGSGTVTFANRMGGFYYARIVNQISFEKILRGNPHRSFVVNFRCQPFFYHADNQPILVDRSGTFVPGQGSVHAEPVLEIALSGDAEIMIGGTLFQLSGITGTVIVDSVHQEVHLDYQSCMTAMTGDFPRLLPIGSYINWTGGVRSIRITPNWRSL